MSITVTALLEVVSLKSVLDRNQSNIVASCHNVIIGLVGLGSTCVCAQVDGFFKDTSMKTPQEHIGGGWK